MPFSSNIGKKETGQWFQKNNESIKRILDLGAGSGTYSKLIKQDYQTCLESEWTAVEAWKPYIDQYELHTLYNTVINSDIRLDVLDTLGKFDVAIAGDILEHMTKEDAMIVVQKILSISTTLIISLPVCYYPQDAYEGNPYEIHVKPNWSHEEVMETWGSRVSQYHVGIQDLPGNEPLKIGVYWLT